MDLQAIAYVSAESRPLSISELEAILIGARTHNARRGVTGVLLHHERNFLQYFEGPPEEVAETYARIRASTAHTGIIELHNERIAQREFGDWTMGIAEAPESLLLELSTALWKRDFRAVGDPATASPGLNLLHSFWSSSRRVQGSVGGR
jgi:hypothetical protein